MNSIFALASATVNELALIAHLLVIDARNTLWVAEDPTHRMAGSPVVDLDYLREYGYDSIARFERSQKECQYWEDYRYAYGIKPRWINFSEISDEGLDAMLVEVQNSVRWENERIDKERQDEIILAMRLTELFGFSKQQLEQWAVIGDNDYEYQYLQERLEWEKREVEEYESEIENFYLLLEGVC